MQWLAEDIMLENVFPTNADAAFRKDNQLPEPSPVLLHYQYGVAAVYQWAHSLKEELWVFEGGCWSKNKQLYKAVQAANWDDIVLDNKFKEGLKRDTETFFSSKEIYRSLSITWKRGILLLGPPGNGKTESIKALLKEAECAVLYAKSFGTRQVGVVSHSSSIDPY